MATFAFELVSPERLLFSGQVEQVIVPGIDGDFAVLPGHVPFMTMLRPGVLSMRGVKDEQRVFLRGGFADVSESGLSVMAEQAIPVEELGPSGLDDEIHLAEKVREAASTEDARQLAGERLAQMITLKQVLYG